MKTSGILFFLFLLIVFGCQKDTATNPTTQPGDKNTAEGSILIANLTFEGLDGLVYGYFSASGLKSGALENCPLISTTAITSFPIVVTCDWGTAGCISTVDGITRSGKIIISLSGHMKTANSIATFTFDDFVADGNKITGVHRITYIGLNEVNNWPRYSVFTEAKIEFPDTKFITYRSENTRLHSEGSTTTAFADDVWHIEGASSGTTREGKDWTAINSSALVKKASCKWFSQGSVIITPESELPRTIDFGNGTCDNKAMLTIGDKTIEISL